MSYNYLPLDSSPTGFQQIKNLIEYRQLVSITFKAHEAILRCREYLDQRMSNADELVYGVNTGFGYLQNVRVDQASLEELQKNLLMSHACGMGEEVPGEIVKLMLMLKIKSLSYGHSGVQIETVKRLMEMYNNEVLPVIYTQGSLGASGDLAPLSHLSLPLIGMGVVKFEGKIYPASEINEKFGWQPISLQSKEGLALINGTQFMSAYGLWLLVQCERLLKWADIISAISIDAFGCRLDPFDASIHNIRNHPAQADTARTINLLLKDSSLAKTVKEQVQDPYSFRCIPQVHGASKDALKYVQEVFIREINSVTDNPNIFPDEDKVLSGGNFHGQPLAISLDLLSIAIAEIGSISERRTYQLISGQRGLPPFLVKNAGLNSGFMIPQYTSAGIVSENKQLCTPSSVDTIPSSNNQEDHVSMGANAATKAYRVVNNVERVLAIELMTAVQALDFRKPASTSSYLQNIIAGYREKVSFNDADRIMFTDMNESVEFIRNYSLKKLS